MNTVDQDNEIEKTKRLTALRLQARTFRELFSSPLGKTVLDTLESKFGHGIAMNILDNTGRTDALQTWRRQGSNDVINYIHTQLLEKEHVDPSSSSP